MKEVDLRELALKKVKIIGNVIGKFGIFEIEQVYKNNTKNETQYSFSEDDIALFNKYNLKTLRGIDNKYTYELTRDSEGIDEITISDLINEESGVHALNINRASRMNIGYRRWKNDRKRI